MSVKQINYMKIADLIPATLLFVGGVNWGLMGFFGIDLIASIFGSMSLVSRTIYALVGVSALYEVVMWKSIQRRWECAGLFSKTESVAA
jgi:uncharacterized membrane protein YuzA (DUF378 family)